MRDVAGAEATDDATVVVRFAPARARDVPLFVAGAADLLARLLCDAASSTRSTLELPLGCGPYKVGRFEAGRFIEYDRVEGLVGRRPAGRARAEQFRHRALRVSIATATSRFEGFTAKSYLFREEFTSRIWATRYDFPGHQRRPRQARRAARRHAVGRAGLVHQHAARRSSRTARCARRSIYAFDFEWTNKTIMYGSYERTHSVFQNSDMMAVGKPSAGGARAARAVPRQGAGRGVRRAVRAAGVRRLGPGSRAAAQGDRSCCRRPATSSRDGKRVTPKGEPHHHRVPDRRAGVPAAPHAVHQEPRHARHRRDAARRRSGAVPQRASTSSTSTSPSQRFGLSIDAGRLRCSTYSPRRRPRIKGSHNLAGIADPVIDALIDKIIAAETRAELTTACRALDRVFRAGRYWIPHWYKPSHWIAYWDVFGRPPTKPRYAPRRPRDLVVRCRDKAARLERAG